MSYFADDPWASSPGSSAPAYSFGEQPAAPQPAFAASQPTFAAPQTALEDPQPVFAGAQPAVAAPYTAFAAPQPAFATPQPAFSAPQTAQAFPPPVFAAQAGAPVFNQDISAQQSGGEFNWSAVICFCGCSCSVFFIPFIIIAVIASSGALDGPNGPGGPPGQYNMATSFVDQGSIDGLTLGICDGNFKYNVTTSGIIQSDNYPASYNPQTSCTNQFYSTADGITFEFQSFFTEQHFDFIVFRDSAGNDFGGQSCSGFMDGTRVSVDSSRLPISIFFKSDHMEETSGFSIVVSGGYDSSSEIANGPCGSQNFVDYNYYYK